MYHRAIRNPNLLKIHRATRELLVDVTGRPGASATATRCLAAERNGPRLSELTVLLAGQALDVGLDLLRCQLLGSWVDHDGMILL